MTLATVEQARAAILEAVRPLDVIQTPLDQADGRWLAEDIVALRDQPPFDASAMDGWAIQSSDARPGVRLTVTGESAAGHAPSASVGAGLAARVLTGASLPQGADRVVIQEEARREGDYLILGPNLSQAAWVRPKGGDFRHGDTLLFAGVRLNPWRIALAAAAGRGSVLCARRPRVRILSTGDELVSPGSQPSALQIFDSAGPGLIAVARRCGAEVSLLDPVGDNDAALAAAMDGGALDLLVTIGGASVGDHDRVKPVARSLGADLRVDGVAVRPGRPLWFGLFPDGRAVLGLPGNPVSALVCAELFLAPLLAAMQGGTAIPAFESAVLAGHVDANGAREHYLRGRAVRDETGFRVTPARAQDSSLVTMLAHSDTLIRRAAFAPAAAEGETVEVLSAGALAGGCASRSGDR